MTQSTILKKVCYENYVYTIEKKLNKLFIKSEHYAFLTSTNTDTASFMLCITEEGHNHIVSHLEINPELSNLFLISVTMTRELLDCRAVYVFLEDSKEYYIIPTNSPKYTVQLNIWTMYFYKKSWSEQMFGAFPTRYEGDYRENEALFYINEQCRLENSLTEKEKNIIQSYTAYNLDCSKFTEEVFEINTVYEYVECVKKLYPETYLNYLGGWYYHYLYTLSTFYWAVIIKSVPNVQYTVIEQSDQNETTNIYYPLSKFAGGYTFTKWYIDGNNSYSLELPKPVDF